MPTQYVDGEEEHIEPIVLQGQRQLAAITRKPVPDAALELLRWLVREAFRRGHEHAHNRQTVHAELWPDDEVTK